MSKNLGLVDDVTPSQRPALGTFSQDARKAADAYFAHKREHPETTPVSKLTPLQKRMQSEGA